MQQYVRAPDDQGSGARKKRRLQFGLRSLFILTAICAIVLSLFVSFPGFFLRERFGLTILIWLELHLPVSAILCAPVWWFGRKRAGHWYRWEFLVLVIPYLIWRALGLILGANKGLGNLFAEPFVLGAATMVAPVTRILVAGRIPPRLAAAGAFAVACAMAFVVWRFFPSLPE
jgi:hypothetical protein